MTYIHDGYTKTVWQDVPDPTSPPPGAEEISAANLNHIEQGIFDTRMSLHDAHRVIASDTYSGHRPGNDWPATQVSIQYIASVTDGYVTPNVSPDTGVAMTGGTVMTVKAAGAEPSNTHQLAYFGGQIYTRYSVNLAKNEWQANHTYQQNDIIMPTRTGGKTTGYYYQYTSASNVTSAATEPDFRGTTNPTDGVGGGAFTWTRINPFWSPWTRLVRGDDTRLTNSRTPNAHKATHVAGQPDALTPADIAAAAATDPVVSGKLTATPQNTQAITGVGVQITPNSYIKLVNPNGNYTLTGAPTVTAGVEGQLVTLFNISTTNTLTLNRHGNGSVNSNLRLTGTTIALAPRSSVQLIYLNDVTGDNGMWYQISPVTTIAT